MKIKLIIALFAIYRIASAQGIWTQKADFAGTARYGAAGFSIGNKVYIGTGVDGAVQKDFWEWNKSSNVWTQKTDFGGVARYGAVGFSVGAKGYIGTGMDASSIRKKDFWEYDPALNNWTQKTDFGGTAREGAVGFSIGNKGYIGTGQESVSIYKQDFWEWDGDVTSPTYDTWVQKTDFGGTVRSVSVGFAAGNKGYIGTGIDTAGTVQNDFWEWDGDIVSPTYNTWVQKTNFGGVARFGAVGFSIGTKAYIGVGRDGAMVYQQDFWEWDQASNTWLQVVNFGGTARNVAVGFSIGTKAYMGTGYGGAYQQDFWQWNPVPLSATVSSTNPLCFGQCNGTATVAASGGAPSYAYLWSPAAAGQTTQTATGLCDGTYTITVTDADGDTFTATVTLIQPPLLTAAATATAVSCNGGSDGTASASASGGSAPYTYLWSSGQTTSAATALGSGSYSITVTDTNACSITQTVTITQPNPLIITTAPSATVCLGNCTTLTAAATGGNGGNTYLWQPGNLTTTAVTLCPSTTTGYTVTATDIKNCMDTTFSNITVNSLPIVTLTLNPDTVCLNSASFALTGGSPNGGTYSGTGVAAGNFYPATAGIGTYTISYSYSDTNGCADTATAQIVVDACLSIQYTSNNQSVLLFPNPSAGIFTIQVSGIRYQVSSMEIYNVMGEKVYQSIINDHSSIINLDVPNGIYFICLKSEQGQVVQKLIIQK